MQQQGNLIAKDSNDETGYYSEVHYREYYGEDGSITGTAAYDRARLKKGVKYYYMVSAYGEKGTRIASLYDLGIWYTGCFR